MTPKQVERAAELLDEDARAIFDTHTLRGYFVGPYAQEEWRAHKERRECADALRAMLERYWAAQGKP